MRVLVDSHAIIWYLADDPRLGVKASDAIDEALSGEGVAIAAASLIDLWYATHKKGSSRITSEDYERVKSILIDEQSNVDVSHFRSPRLHMSNPYQETTSRIRSIA